MEHRKMRFYISLDCYSQQGQVHAIIVQELSFVAF